MSKAIAPGAADAKKASTTQPAVNQAASPKSVTELLEAQKKFFSEKNEILKKLSIFENTENLLLEAQTSIEEESEEIDIFEDSRSFALSISGGYSKNICTIKKPIIIKSVIDAVLAEISKSRQALEADFLK